MDSAKTIITSEVEYNRVFEQFNANFVLNVPRPPFKEFYKVFELKMDVCQFFKGAYQNKYVKAAYLSMMKHSNMPKTCPQPKVSRRSKSQKLSEQFLLFKYFKGFYYYHNMSIGDNLPPFLPKYDFKVQLDFFLPNVPVYNLSLSGRLTDPTRHRG